MADALDVDMVHFFCAPPCRLAAASGRRRYGKVGGQRKAISRETGLSQEALSTKAHRFRTYVGRQENGAASPKVVDLQDPADALGGFIPILLR